MGLDTVELVDEVEKKFNITIPNKEASLITTVGDFHNVVWKHLQAKIINLHPLTHVEVEALINNIIANKCGMPLLEITPEKTICGDLGLD